MSEAGARVEPQPRLSIARNTMKQQGRSQQAEHGGAPEKGGSFKRGPRPEPRVEPQRDAERDRYGSPGESRDAAGREPREAPKERDEYGDFLRDGEADDSTRD
jgi:hypothetical protein